MKVAEGLLLAGCMVILTPLFASCAPAAEPTPAASKATPAAGGSPVATPKPAVEPAAGGRYGGVLTRPSYEDPGHLDAHQVSTGAAIQILASVYNGLARFDPQQVDKIIPDLAEKWEVSLDGQTYTFYLKKGVRWHDGKPLTAADAKISMERMAFPKEHKIVSPRGQQLLFALEGVERAGDDVFKVRLKQPSTSFVANLASGYITVVPKHIIDVKGDMKKDALGTGGFKFKSWNYGVSLELVKNADYFMKGLPYLDGVTFYVIKDDATRFAAFRTGRVRMTYVGSAAMSHPQAEIARKEMAEQVNVVQHPAFRRFMFIVNVKRKPWDDVRMRKATDLALDRQAAVKMHNNVGTLGGILHPKGGWGMKESEIITRPGYRQPKDADIAEAKRLVSEAGHAGGVKSTLVTRGMGDTAQMAEVMKEQLGKIGVDLALEPKETAVAEARLNRHEFDTACWAVADPLDDPDIAIGGYYVTGVGRNYGEFSDKKIDELYDKQSRAVDPVERKKLVMEIQERLLEASIYPVLFWDVYNIGFWKEVRGYVPGPGHAPYNNLDHVWLAK